MRVAPRTRDQRGAARPQQLQILRRHLHAVDGEDAALRLWRDAAIRVLPGGYTARAANGRPNPGQPYIRLAVVHDEATLETAFERIRRVL